MLLTVEHAVRGTGRFNTFCNPAFCTRDRVSDGLCVSSDIYNIFIPLRPQFEDHTTSVSKSVNHSGGSRIVQGGSF